MAMGFYRLLHKQRIEMHKTSHRPVGEGVTGGVIRGTTICEDRAIEISRFLDRNDVLRTLSVDIYRYEGVELLCKLSKLSLHLAQTLEMRSSRRRGICILRRTDKYATKADSNPVHWPSTAKPSFGWDVETTERY